MTRQSTAKRSTYSASNAVQALGDAIAAIKHEDGLTWADIGAVLGKSEDQAAKYADGTATMDAITFGRGKREWNGRFTGLFDRLCVDSRPGAIDDHSTLSAVIDAAAKLSHDLADGKITQEEVWANRTVLENARDAIEDQLRKLTVSAA